MKNYDTKYLTQIKELPPEGEEEVRPIENKKPTEVSDNSSQVFDQDNKVSETLTEQTAEEIKSERIFTSKDIILNIVNFISIVLLILILVAFPKKAKKLNDLETEKLLAEAYTSFRLEDIKVNLEKSQQIENLFLDESGLVDFVSEVEKVKNEIGAVESISFASQVAVKDRTGNFGVPVVIELVGSWEEIGKSLEKIDNLPFLFRAARVEIAPSKEDDEVLEFKYGIFLYVHEKLGQNR